MQCKNQHGFTLIELSIVLIIIGLIVGGVLVGQDLIKAAELRKVISEVETIKTAINTFKVKYNALPGDFSEATSYWGTATQDGNNDGRLSISENINFFEQLGLANITPTASYKAYPFVNTTTLDFSTYDSKVRRAFYTVQSSSMYQKQWAGIYGHLAYVYGFTMIPIQRLARCKVH